MRRTLLVVIASVAAVAGCGSTSASSTASTTTVTATTVTPTTAPPAPVSTTTDPVVSLGQTIVVAASAYGRSVATVTAYDETSTGWVRRFGPWTASIGRNGFAPPGAKREGDGRIPSGTYGFSFFFGIRANPGVAFPYRRITSTAIVWDDDSTSARYNEWVDTRDPGADAGTHPEPMYDAPFYDYGAVIAYNTARTPGLGSAIFLHVSNGDSTAGCVALPVSELLQVLRWLTPTRNPQIRMGVNAPRP